MKRSLMLAAAALAMLTVVAAGCGDTDEVPPDAVAVVDGTPISKSTLDELLTRTKKTYAAQKRQFPKAGTWSTSRSRRRPSRSSSSARSTRERPTSSA